MWERKCYNNCGRLKMDCVPVAVGKCVRMSHTKQGVQEYKERMSSLMFRTVGRYVTSSHLDHYVSKAVQSLVDVTCVLWENMSGACLFGN